MSTTIIPGPNVFRAISGSLFSTAANWSKGFVPSSSDAAVINDNCTIDINRTLGSLIVNAPFTASVNTGLTLQVNTVINSLGSISSSGTSTILSLANKNIVNNFQPGNSTFHYSGSVNQSVFGGIYNNLTVSNTGIKTLSSNLIVSGNLAINQGSALELSNSNLEVSGTFSMNTSTLSKRGYGQVIFNGLVVPNGRIDFPGSPIVEFRNGINVSFSGFNSQNFGNNIVIFTTRDQLVTGNTAITFTPDVLISGSNTITIDLQSATFLGFINGTDPLSKIVSKTTINLLTPRSVERCMTTGVLDITSFNNFVNINGDHISVMSPNLNSFRNLAINNGLKTAGANISVSGSFATSRFELGNFNLTVTGSSTIFFPGPLSKSGPGNVIFIGNIDITNAGLINFSSGNPTVELRGGLTNTSNGSISSGTGSWNFTTNNQLINTNNNLTFNAPISIQNIAVTCSGNGGLILNAPINGTTSNSTIVNRAGITFATATSLTGSLLTGSYDFNSSVNTIGIGGDYTATIPARFSSSLFNLSISGLGSKSLATDIYISGTLSVNGSSPTVGGYFDISGSNLFVSGTSTGTNGTLVKSGPGRITFGGYANFGNGNVFNLTGNPTVEFQNGCFIWKNNAGFQNLGTGSYIFSTRNQTVSFANGDFYGTVSKIHRLIVSGAIAVTASSPFNVEINDTITGTDPSSIFSLGPTSLYINTTSSLMPTGTLDLSNTGSAVGFVYSDINVSNYNIPYTNFSGSLFVAGLHTTKSLSGNTYVRGAMNGFIQGSSAVVGILECGNHDLFVSGAVNAPTRFFKSGPGYVTFNGNVTMANGVSLSLTGHPTLEFRNSLYLLLNNTGFWNTGTGSFVFTTNPVQTLFLSHQGGYTLQNPIIISGSVNLIYTGSSGIIHAGVFNGTDANSRLTINNNQTVTYNASQQPMLTGSIDFSSSLNTFVYNSGSQNVRGGTYRNLTMLNGTKTLQGNVSVLGTLNTGSGATLATINLNGFTLTNP